MPSGPTTTDQEQSTNARLPRRFVLCVILLSALPSVLNWLGVRFDTVVQVPTPVDASRMLAQEDSLTVLHEVLAGSFVHSLLEWTAFAVALFTAVFAFVHYYLQRNVTTPAIGTALFFSGMIDAFHTLAADGLFGPVADREQFIPFTWAISRTFNVCILIAGTAPFLFRPRSATTDGRQKGIRFILLVALLYGLAAYLIIHVCTISRIPQTVYPKAIVHRPWDAVPLVLYLLAGGIILPRFHRMQPSLFSYALIVSIIPHVAAQAHAAFGATANYDAHFNIASMLKVLAYIVPLAGLLADYSRAYRLETALQVTQQQLRTARNIQQQLLPQQSPEVAGYDLAGASWPADEVGGDYFDFVPMHNGRWGVVIADVSGHEVGASLLMAQTRAYLRALAESHDATHEIIALLNGFLTEDVQNRMFVSLFLVNLDSANDSFTYAAAGHEAHVLKADGQTQHLKRLSPLLGILEDATVPASPEISLEPGNLVVLLTDGVTETVSPGGKFFGVERALQTAAANRHLSAKEIVRALYEAVADFRGPNPQRDDLTVVIVKRSSSAR